MQGWSDGVTKELEGMELQKKKAETNIKHWIQKSRRENKQRRLLTLYVSHVDHMLKENIKFHRLIIFKNYGKEIIKKGYKMQNNGPSCSYISSE